MGGGGAALPFFCGLPVYWSRLYISSVALDTLLVCKTPCYTAAAAKRLWSKPLSSGACSAPGRDIVGGQYALGCPKAI